MSAYGLRFSRGITYPSQATSTPNMKSEELAILDEPSATLRLKTSA